MGARAQTEAVTVNPVTGVVVSPQPITFAAGQIKIGSVTLTPPASAIVGINDTQTLTNKTLVAPAIGAATATSVNGVATTSGTNTFTLSLGTASITVPPAFSGTLAASAITDTTNASNITTGALSQAVMPTQQAWSLVIPGAGPSVASGAWTQITSWAPVTDGDPSSITTASTVTPTVPGLYVITAAAVFIGGGTPYGWAVSVFKNGTEVQQAEGVNTNGYPNCAVTLVVWMNGSTDTLSLCVNQATGSDVTIYGYTATYFSGGLLR